MSNFNPNAPVFIPSFLRQPVGGVAPSDGETNEKEHAVPIKQSPIVVLLFGNRGAGKSTQSALLAKEYNLLNLSSGTIYMEGKQPFVELRRILQEEFGNEQTRRYAGVVLDRFIAVSEFDAFYVQTALNSANLPVPFVIMLSVDPALALQRAEARGDSKTGLQYWRAVEQKAQGVTANTVYAPIKCFKMIQCTAAATPEDVFAEIKHAIEFEIPSNMANVRLPAAARREHAGMRLIEVYEDYMQVVTDVHASVGNTQGRKDSAPLSSIGAYLDRDYFSFEHKNLRSLLSTFHVTLKADGQRFLLVKHRQYGFIGFPAAFTHCYDLNALFDGVVMTEDSLSEDARKFFSRKNYASSPVEFLLDTELVVRNGEDAAQFYVFDYVCLWSLDGKKSRFEQRLKVLREYFKRMPPFPGSRQPVLLKDYVPINKLRTLLPKWDVNMHLPIDGLVFQHNDVYRFGRDKLLIKWKPVELCTADFRLANGIETNGDWTFDLMVSGDPTADGGFGEVPYPDAHVTLTEDIVKNNHLCNGMIVELFLQEMKMSGETPLKSTWWRFKGVRNDKPSPNKYSIVEKIVGLKHLSFKELADLCEKVPFYGTD